TKRGPSPAAALEAGRQPTEPKRPKKRTGLLNRALSAAGYSWADYKCGRCERSACEDSGTSRRCAATPGGSATSDAAHATPAHPLLSTATDAGTAGASSAVHAAAIRGDTGGSASQRRAASRYDGRADSTLAAATPAAARSSGRPAPVKHTLVHRPADFSHPRPRLFDMALFDTTMLRHLHSLHYFLSRSLPRARSLGGEYLWRRPVRCKCNETTVPLNNSSHHTRATVLGFSQMELGGDLAKSGQPNFCWAMSVQLYRHNLFYTLRAPNYLESDREIVVDSRATQPEFPH
ncbi:unnamed protein product, partial [Ilex paraguariensis]